MKRLIVLLLFVGVVLVVNRMRSRFSQPAMSARSSGTTPATRLRHLLPDRNDAAHRFRCDGRVYCSQMTSRAEAVYFIRHCPGTKMDGDHDGIPCENDSRF
jgi:hypothetical protein